MSDPRILDLTPRPKPTPPAPPAAGAAPPRAAARVPAAPPTLPADRGPAARQGLAASRLDPNGLPALEGGEQELALPARKGGYAGPPIDPAAVVKAQTWLPHTGGLSGTEANQRINDTYDAMDRAFTQYLGSPPVANWMTFGKYASREAGEQIRNLENAAKAGLDGKATAAVELARAYAAPAPANQAAHLVGDFLGDAAVKQDALDAVLDPLGTASDTLADAAGTGVDRLFTMKAAMVKGNTEIYKNVAPAYQAFLDGEASGRGGLAALAAAGYTPGSELDPQGFVTQAFESYKAAQGLTARAAAATGEARDQLLQQRRDLMNRGNLLIGCQEQMCILHDREIFGHAHMQDALEAIGGTMQLTDANETHDLRPDGKSWAHFETRMGIKEVPAGTPGAIAVRHYQPGTNEPGETRHYVPDLTQHGTIAKYFLLNASGPRAEKLMSGSPRPLALPAPTHNAVKGLQDMAQGYDQGGKSQLVGGAVRTAGGVGEAVLDGSGSAARFVGEAAAREGEQRLAEGSLPNLAVGSVQYVGGKTIEYAGRGLQTAGRVANAATDLAARGAEATSHAVGAGYRATTSYLGSVYDYWTTW